ncbi:MAG: cytochrome c3 family protein [bacterium]|nr:cytochrome c family protein [bacterium]
MNKKFILISISLFLVSVLVSPSLVHAKKSVSKEASPIALFNHDKHHEYFSNLKTDCKVCHKTENSYTLDTVNKMGCHECHNKTSSPSAKANRFKCVTCHKDLTKVKPANHNLNFETTHQTAAKQDKKTCTKCHKGYFCTACHQQRDTIDQNAHKRNYRYYHSIEARSNPRKCDSCHKVSYCKGCHASN